MEQNKEQNTKDNYVWYRDRATSIALISGGFSTLITLISALAK